jgi:hypothetical protein
MMMEIPINLTGNITETVCQSCVYGCLPFDISRNILILILGYYFITYLNYLFEYLYKSKTINLDLTQLELIKYYHEFTQMALVLIYFALRPTDIYTLGALAALIFGSLIIRKKFLRRPKKEVNVSSGC